MRLELTEAEHSLLIDLLDSAFGDLRSEISNTDTPRYHDLLKERERTMAGLIAKVKAAKSS
jgi:hypothetical protein